jgi:hypothetical protein
MRWEVSAYAFTHRISIDQAISELIAEAIERFEFAGEK